MTKHYSEYELQIEDLLEASRVKISSILPSDWAEQNIIMPKPFPGPLKYEKTPYTREIIDRFSPEDPARDIALMGSAQFGKTASIIIPAIGYIIANDPGNIIMTVGHEDLIAEAMDKIDAMLDTTGLRKLIRPSARRVKAQKTGDTNTIKQFPNGYLKLSPASNPKIWRQTDYKFGLLDDFEAVKGSSKTAGNQLDLIQKRFTAYDKTRKILYCSSPERLQTSNIVPVYHMGDQRKFVIPCPSCGAYIELQWSVEWKNGIMAGMTWKIDENNRLIPESVGYICQLCGEFFTDQYKSEFVNRGYWHPTARPFRPDFFSYHMSSLYSPHGMSDWTHYVYKWIQANPNDGQRVEKKYQTFLNIDMGLPYEETGEAPEANELQKNIRNYDIGTVPEKLSIEDGNGKIAILTCAGDLNGTVNDGRLDWEILAWAENGACYSVRHGSIGTFVPRENTIKKKEDRARWSYEHGKENSVWNELEEMLKASYQTDTGRRMKIMITGLDCGYHSNYAYSYIDKTNYLVLGLKGKDVDKFVRFGVDMPNFKPAQERSKLYMLQVNSIKDDLADCIKLKWEPGDKTQPTGFMNYPIPSGGLYLFDNYFSHYEAEHRVIESKEGEGVAARWLKKTSVSQNHFWDVRVYNMAIKEILVHLVTTEMKIKKGTWSDFINILFKK